jgi:biopolymer transport protein ExbD
MQWTNRTFKRNALAAACLLAFAKFGMAQSKPPDANTDTLTVRISDDGICYFLDDSAPCEQLGKILSTRGLSQNKHIHIVVDRSSKYESVAATLKALQGTGFKVGFVNSEPSTKPTISEGNYIGYATVADAMATLKAQGFLELPGLNGEVSFAASDNKTTWTFVGKNDPAYPSAVRYVYTRSDGVPHVEVTNLCEAPDAPCEKFRGDIRANIAQIAKMMAGDPSVKCRVNYENLKCGAEPARKQTDQQIYVQVRDDATCTVDNVATSCLEVARTIRSEHPADNPKVAVCASDRTKYDVVGRVLGALNEEYFTPAFGCPPD